MKPRTKSMYVVVVFLVLYDLSLSVLIGIIAKTILGLFCFLVGCLFHNCVFLGSCCRVVGSLW
jgi:hypothetical protein